MPLDWPGQIRCEDAIDFRRGRRKQLGHLQKRFEREVHWLELRVAPPNSRAKGQKAQMLVQAQLPYGAGNDREIVTLLAKMMRDQPDQPRENESIPEFLLHRKQSDFQGLAARRQMF